MVKEILLVVLLLLGNSDDRLDCHVVCNEGRQFGAHGQRNIRFAGYHSSLLPYVSLVVRFLALASSFGCGRADPKWVLSRYADYGN